MEELSHLSNAVVGVLLSQVVGFGSFKLTGNIEFFVASLSLVVGLLFFLVLTVPEIESTTQIGVESGIQDRR